MSNEDNQAIEDLLSAIEETPLRWSVEREAYAYTTACNGNRIVSSPDRLTVGHIEESYTDRARRVFAKAETAWATQAAKDVRAAAVTAGDESISDEG